MKITSISSAAMCAALAAAASADFEYSYDDGVRDTNIGPPSSFEKFPNTDMIWGNYFHLENGYDQLTEISLSVGTLLEEPESISLIVWNDPNDDGDPTDIAGAPLTSFDVDVTTTAGGELLSFDLPSAVTVDGGFFVAAALRSAAPGEDRPGAVDTSDSGEHSWLMYSPNLDESNLSDSIGFATRMDNTDFVVFPGAFVLRATAIPAPAAAGLLGLAGILGATHRRR